MKTRGNVEQWKSREFHSKVRFLIFSTESDQCCSRLLGEVVEEGTQNLTRHGLKQSGLGDLALRRWSLTSQASDMLSHPALSVILWYCFPNHLALKFLNLRLNSCCIRRNKYERTIKCCRWG